MLSVVRRYKSLLSATLTRYFPRAAQYWRDEGFIDRAPGKAAPSLRANGKGRQAGKRKQTSSTKKRGANSESGAPRQRSSGIYPLILMPVAEAKAQAMRLKVAAAVAAGLLSPPSDEQWRMILDRHARVRIFAGAGSGKSTTLVLRVVFLLCHLEIDPARLTVISFTNASCAQLRRQLADALAFWQYPFDDAQSRQCVRTFHSAMGAQARDILGQRRWFEQLDDPQEAAELDNPLTNSRLRPAQQRLLKQVYQRCYVEEEAFRAKVHQLLGSPLPEKVTKSSRAPLDPLKLDGEFTALPLFEALYAQVGFLESLGLRADRLDTASLSCPERERLFAEALAIYWPQVEAQLREQGLMTFNMAFRELTERLADAQQAISVPSLESLSHLLIDEFQDISPQIVAWLRALHQRLARNKQKVSLMAIGDDWQSIYGWRGSSPELFMDFDRHFPGRGKAARSTTLLLETNYRSIDAIIRDGEAVLRGVAFKQDKTCQAFRQAEDGDHGVRLVTGFDLGRGLPRLLNDIRDQCAAKPGEAPPQVLLLSRRNETLKTITAQLDRALPVKAYSIHRAKGLQADIAIIVDDCATTPSHPLRNALYRQCGYFRNDYDQAMQDEQLRLAYVAITRGARRVFWYTKKIQGATRELQGRG